MAGANTKKILIVDDDEDVRNLLSQYFTRKGFTTEEAYDGRDGLKRIKKAKPDLIILDVNMPKMDGFQLLQYLKSHSSYSAIPIIMLTVKSKPQHLDKGIYLGADFYLPKPFNLNNLMKFVKIITA